MNIYNYVCTVTTHQSNLLDYLNDFKYVDRQVKANSEDPDQSGSRAVDTVWYSVCII